jgi:hypothetical protein
MSRRAKGTRAPNLRSSIYHSEADGLWHGWVTMGTKNDGSPDRRHRTAKTEPEVTRKVRELEAKRDAGKVDKPGRAPTVADWMTTYLDTICERLVSSGTMAPRTLDDYRSKTRLWIIPLLGLHRLDRLLPENLDAAYQQMFDAGLSSSTVLKVHRILSRALTIAVRRDKVSRNVATLVDAPTPNIPRSRHSPRRRHGRSSTPPPTGATAPAGRSRLRLASARAKRSACAGLMSISTPVK